MIHSIEIYFVYMYVCRYVGISLSCCILEIRKTKYKLRK